MKKSSRVIEGKVFGYRTIGGGMVFKVEANGQPRNSGQSVNNGQNQGDELCRDLWPKNLIRQYNILLREDLGTWTKISSRTEQEVDSLDQIGPETITYLIEQLNLRNKEFSPQQLTLPY